MWGSSIRNKLFALVKKFKVASIRCLFPRWATPAPAPLPGYTILMLLPGDILVFFKIALQVILAQRTRELVEILLIPDKPTPAFRALVKATQAAHPSLSFRLVESSPKQKLIRMMTNRPHTNCWMQFFRGVQATRTQYALWHDSDLFITNPDFVEGHYAQCQSNQFACTGVSQAWDPWLVEQGYPYVNSTWELMLDVEWVRSFKPLDFLGQKAVIKGMEEHEYDITFIPQCLTPPERIGRNEADIAFVHFNYVISTYRYFQNAHGPYEDKNFRLLLIRLLINAYQDDRPEYEVPCLDGLAQGISDAQAKVTYVQDVTRTRYADFREKFEELLQSGSLDAAQQARCREDIAPFDEAFMAAEIRPV